MSNSAALLLEQAHSLLESAAAQPVGTLSDEELCALMVATERAGRFLDSIRIATAAELDDRSRFELGSDGLAYRLGARRGVHLVESLTLTSQGEAARRIRVGTATNPRTTLDGRPLPAERPHVAMALHAGTMAVDAAAVVVRALAQAARHGADPADLDAAEQDLVAAAAHESADNIDIMAKAWRDALDPDGAEPREEALREKRGFTLGRERNGMTPFWGNADPVSAAQLHAAFAESTAPDAAPRFLDETDTARGAEIVSTPDGDIVERVIDPRSREQRQLDVLLGLITAGLRSKGQRSTVTVMATVDLADLMSGRGIALLSDVVEPISAATAQELACDAGYRRVLLGYDGEPLAQGDLERYFTPAQRRLLAVRDGGCVWPQCTAPPSWCHAHHVVEWANGGPTDVDNGVLLCAAHHHMLHNSPFTMKIINGIPHLLAPPWLDPTREWKRVGRARLRRRRAVPGRVAA